MDRSRDGQVWEALHVGHAIARSAEFDLVHNNLDWLPLALSAHCRAPLVTTIHGFSDPRILPAYLAADSAYVSISNADRVPELDYCATVYHGIDLSRFAFSATPSEDLVILGRIHPDKGTAEAIEIARRCGRRLLIAGPVQDEGYFAAEIAPHVDDDRVCYLGSVGPSSGRSCWPPPPSCCIQSRSPSRSAWPWLRRWPRERRSWRTREGPCPRWWTRG